MLRKIGHISALESQYTSPLRHGLNFVGLFSKLSVSGANCYLCSVKSFHSCGTLNKDFKKSYERERSQKTLMVEQEAMGGSLPHNRMIEIFPDKDLPTRLFNGIMFKEIPIVNIKVTQNNTIMTLTDAKGIVKAIRSCGVEGFKNAKKGTNLAAQATALTFSRKVIDAGYKTVRVRIQGIGPGRISSLRGLTMGGLEVISVTDNTHVSENPAKGKKLRRI